MPIRRNIDKYVALQTYPLLVTSHGKSLLLLGVGVDSEGRGVEDGSRFDLSVCARLIYIAAAPGAALGEDLQAGMAARQAGIGAWRDAKNM